MLKAVGQRPDGGVRGLIALLSNIMNTYIGGMSVLTTL